MVQEAGLVNLIKTIAIIFAVYYGLKLIGRYVFPWLLKRFINKQQEKFYNQTQSGNSRTERQEGEVKITGAPQRSSKKDDLGEYVDYEEIKDDKK